MRPHRYIGLLGSAFSVLLSVSVQAQQTTTDSTLVRTVIVENEYNPDLLDASKVNILPKVEEPVVTKKDIEYSQTPMPAASLGTYQELLPLTQKEFQPDALRGYARLGYGNRGNIDARLSYLFALSARDQLGISASLDGLNGKIKYDGGLENKSEWKSRFYRTNVNLDYKHLFDKVEMSVKGNYGLNLFNYLTDPLSSYWPESDKQHTNKARFALGVASVDDSLPLEFTAEVGYSYYDRKYSWSNLIIAPDKEQIIHAKADVSGEITDGQKVGLGVNLNQFLYSRTEARLKDYTSVQLNPYYNYSTNNIEIRLGVHADLASHLGKGFVIAPDVALQFAFAESYKIYLKAGGGRELVDYRRLEVENPYWGMPLDWKSINIPLDAKIGFKASPVNGFWFDLFGGYTIRNNDLCFTNGIVNLSQGSYSGGEAAFEFEDTKVFYGGAHLQYAYKDLLSMSVKGVYSKWDANDDYYLLMKPEFNLDASVDVKLIDNLYLNLGYNYVTRPVAYEKKRLDPINNLTLGGSYKFFKNFSVYARINNLLNKEYQYYVNYPSQGFNFVAGISCSF